MLNAFPQRGELTVQPPAFRDFVGQNNAPPNRDYILDKPKAEAESGSMKAAANNFDADELNLLKLAREYNDADKARALLESFYWPNGPVCPHCKNDGKAKAIYSLRPQATSKTPARKGLYKCGACRKQFTVTVGTIFESSHIPAQTWLMAIFILCSSKKSVSAHQLHRMLGVTYKTAWFLAHRIRFAMGTDLKKDGPLKGTVEADETFVGGKGDLRTRYSRHTTVAAIVERGGEVRTRVIPSVTALNVGKFLNECVSKDAVVNTDEHGAYRVPAKRFKRHGRVVHARKQYALKLPDGSLACTNTAESFFSLLKRGVFGAWHCVSREHLAKYAGEFEFRWNTRGKSDGARMLNFFPRIEGKRLMYRRPAA